MASRNPVASVRIGLASPAWIRARSGGEVRLAEGLDWETGVPMPGGLFDEAIFGSLEAPSSATRFGHIELASPIAHPWFVHGPHSPLALMCGVDDEILADLLAFRRAYVYKPFRNVGNERGESADRRMRGPGAVHARLADLDLDVLIDELRDELADDLSNASSQLASPDHPRHLTFRRLHLAESLRLSGQRPEWMILTILPVLPVALRAPQLDGDDGIRRDDLNYHYREVVQRSNRLRQLADSSAGDSRLRLASLDLSQAVGSLFETLEAAAYRVQSRALRDFARVSAG